MTANRLLCPVCSGHRMCRFDAGRNVFVWDCPQHPEADAPDLHDMAAMLASSACGKISAAGAFNILRAEIISLGLKG